MGEPKLLLAWAGTTIIGYLLSLWHTIAAEQIAVVCAPSPHPLHVELDRLKFPNDARILNPSPELGMFSSIQCAARWPSWNNELTHIALLLGDQPQIRSETLEALLRHATANPDCICQPALKQRPKHPLVFPTIAFKHLARTSSTTLRHFLENSGMSRSFFETSDESLATDLDTPTDYANAIRGFSGASGNEQDAR